MSLFNHYYYTTSLSHTSQYDTYLAYPEDDPEHRVVLKVFDAKCMLPTATYEDFQRMERRLQGLKHPHIVAMLKLGREQGRPYLVSEYQSGSSLREHLDHLSSGHLSLDNAVAIVMQVGQAVAFAHTQGVVHEDIRPENILLNDQGHALLTNFFLGDIIRAPGLKDRSDRRAVSYLSPEQTIGIAGPASDQYALGCLLYELVTGKLPTPVSLPTAAFASSTHAPTYIGDGDFTRAGAEIGGTIPQRYSVPGRAKASDSNRTIVLSRHNGGCERSYDPLCPGCSCSYYLL